MSNIRTKPVRFDSAITLARACEDYFVDCELFDRIPNAAGLACHLGMSLKMLSKLAGGTVDTPVPNVDYVASQAMTRCEAAQCNVTKPEFLLKNHHGYADKTETAHKGDMIIMFDSKDKQA